MSNIFPKEPSSFCIEGPQGLLELKTTWIESAQPLIAVIAHPHPLHQGSMHNKVVTTLMQAFNTLGLSTVRFNFRGVGKSEGHYGNAIGELEDLRAVLNWVMAALPTARIWLAGFSFGSYIAAAMAKEWPVGQLVSIAPPVNQPYFKDLHGIEAPWLVVQGEKDEIIDPEAVWEWAACPPAPLKLIRLPGIGHFFHGYLTELRELLVKELSSNPDLLVGKAASN